MRWMGNRGNPIGQPLRHTLPIALLAAIAAPMFAQQPQYLVVSLHDFPPGSRAMVQLENAEFVGSPLIAEGIRGLELLDSNAETVTVAASARIESEDSALPPLGGPFGFDGTIEATETSPPSATFAIPISPTEVNTPLVVNISVPHPAYALTRLRHEAAIENDVWALEVYGLASTGTTRLEIDSTRRRSPPGCKPDCIIESKTCGDTNRQCYEYYTVFYCCDHSPY